MTLVLNKLVSFSRNPYPQKLYIFPRMQNLLVVAQKPESRLLTFQLIDYIIYYISLKYDSKTLTLEMFQKNFVKPD